MTAHAIGLALSSPRGATGGLGRTTGCALRGPRGAALLGGPSLGRHPMRYELAVNDIAVAIVDRDKPAAARSDANMVRSVAVAGVSLIRPTLSMDQRVEEQRPTDKSCSGSRATAMAKVAAVSPPFAGAGLC